MRLRFLIPTLLLLVAACGDDKKPVSDAREDGGLKQTDEDVNGIVSLADGGVDAGLIVLTCEGADDGANCGSMGGLICLSDDCVSSTCGDGFANAAHEECDDGNQLAGDGCEPDCTFTCSEVGECDDGNACNGNEVCDTADHVCVLGTTAVDETPCMNVVVEDGECRTGICVPKGCGDMSVEGEEECDDGNQISGDGCEPSCTYSCEEDVDCDDSDVCNGTETCNAEDHVCVPGTTLECDAQDACHTGSCHPERGCESVLIDADGDRYAPIMDGCGDDCDDTRADVNPGQVELCDEIDQNCDGEAQPKEAPTWYVDCDADGFAEVGAETAKQCEMPAPTACGGRWTTVVPSNSADPPTADCYDRDASVNPSQVNWFAKPSDAGFDYNCDRDEEMRWTKGKLGVNGSCSSFGGFGCSGPSGWTGGIPGCGDRSSFTECRSSGGSIEKGGGPIIKPIDPCDGRFCTCSRVVVDRPQECR